MANGKDGKDGKKRAKLNKKIYKSIKKAGKKALTIDVSGGNPTMNGATSTLAVHVYYKILTL